jgi:undecaprenyl pyrophosphate synthase
LGLLDLFNIFQKIDRCLLLNIKCTNFSKKLISKIFLLGSNIPQSVAIIMDGNRRYAEKKKMEKIKGHEDSLSKLLDVLQWCIELQIKELTVFSFSIDNFNRPHKMNSSRL